MSRSSLEYVSLKVILNSVLSMSFNKFSFCLKSVLFSLVSMLIFLVGCHLCKIVILDPGAFFRHYGGFGLFRD